MRNGRRTRNRPITMGGFFHLLSPAEKAICVAALRADGSYPDASISVLPFIQVQKVLDALDKGALMIGNVPGRLLPNLIAKINGWAVTKRGIALKLDAVKVHKRFGARPELGRALPQLGIMKGTKRIQIFGEWHEVDNPSGVVVALREVGAGGWWQVSCNEKYRPVVERWLIDYCR